MPSVIFWAAVGFAVVWFVGAFISERDGRMKILGKTGSSVLVEVSPDELTQMTGLERFEFQDMTHHDGVWRSVIGLEFQLTDIYQRIRLLNANADELARVRKMLRSIADVLEPLNVEVPRLEKVEVTDGE